MKTLPTLLLIALTGLFLSCKKKDSATTQNTTSGTGGSVVTSSVYPSNALSFDGIITMRSYTYHYYQPIGTFTNLNASAYFSSVPVNYSQIQSGIRAGKVYLNKDSLMFDQNSLQYNMVNPFADFSVQTWSVSGANGIPAFKYTTTMLAPSYQISSAWPDSISKNKGLTLSLALDNVKSGTFIMGDGTSNPGGSYVAKLYNGKNEIKLAPSLMASMTATTSGVVMIILENAQALSFGNKDVNFVKEASFIKQFKITP